MAAVEESFFAKKKCSLSFVAFRRHTINVLTEKKSQSVQASSGTLQNTTLKLLSKRPSQQQPCATSFSWCLQLASTTATLLCRSIFPAKAVFRSSICRLNESHIDYLMHATLLITNCSWMLAIHKAKCHSTYRISANSFRGSYSFLKAEVRKVFKGGKYSREETIFFAIF